MPEALPTDGPTNGCGPQPGPGPTGGQDGGRVGAGPGRGTGGSVLMVRHAQSVWNAEARWQGHADPPLSPLGEAQAAGAAAGLATRGPIDLLVTSDLERARRTGELLVSRTGRAVPLVIEPALREFDVGAWSGLTRAEIDARYPDEVALFDAGRLAAPPGGESRAAFEARVIEAAGRVATAIARHGARRTVVVSHGGVVRALGRLQGLGDRHVSQLCGYAGRPGGAHLALSQYVDLLAAVAPGSDHRAAGAPAAGPPAAGPPGGGALVDPAAVGPAPTEAPIL